MHPIVTVVGSVAQGHRTAQRDVPPMRALRISVGVTHEEVAPIQHQLPLP